MISHQVASSSPAQNPFALRGELVHDGRGRRHRVLFPVHAAGKLWRLPRFGGLLDTVLGWLLEKAPPNEIVSNKCSTGWANWSDR